MKQSSCSSSSRFGQSEALNTVTAVALPPGRLKLATRPSLTGSPAVAKTIGVAEWRPLRRVCGRQDPPRISLKLDGQPGRPRAPRADQIAPQPSGIRLRRSDPRRSPLPSAPGGTPPPTESRQASDLPLRNPITGIASCCARAASGQADTAPLSSVMNSRLFTQSPRRRERVWRTGLRDRASLRF